MGLLNIREKEYTEVPVRAILAVIITFGLTLGFLFGLILPSDFKEVAMIVLVFYFAKRNENDQQVTDAANEPPSIPLNSTQSFTVPTFTSLSGE